MGKIAKRSAKAQESLEIIESALEKTQSALHAAERADVAVGKVVKGSRKLIKLILIASVIGVAVLIAKKVLGGSGSAPAPVPTSAPNSKPQTSSEASKGAGKAGASDDDKDDTVVVDLASTRNGSKSDESAGAGSKGGDAKS